MARKREGIGDVEPKAGRKPAKKAARKPAKKASKKAARKPAHPVVPKPKPPRIEYKYAGRRPRHGLDEDTIEAVCVEVATGLPLADVMDKFMIRLTELQRWLQRGNEFLDKGEPKEWQIFAEFVVGFKAANADHAAFINRKLHESDDWRCYFKIAERRFPHIYGANPEGGSDQVFNPDDQFL